MAKAKKRADGRYCAQIYLGRDENGRRKYKSIYAKSPVELKKRETAIRLQLGQGLDVLSQRDAFSTWADDWLRHTFCTLLYMAGVDVVQACAQLGHADVSTTLRIYTHLDAIHKRKSVDKLDAYLDAKQA